MKTFDPAVKWRKGTRYTFDAQEAYDELLRIKGDAAAFPYEATHEAARAEDHILHTAFTWDPTVALDKCNRQEFRELQGSFVIIDVLPSGKEVEKGRATASVPGVGYVEVAVVAASPDWFGKTVRALLDHISGVERDVEELCALRPEADLSKIRVGVKLVREGAEELRPPSS